MITKLAGWIGAALAVAAVDAAPPPSGTDWLLDPTGYEAVVEERDGERELVLENGLVRRRWRLEPNAATVGLDDLVTGTSLLRAVRPEARLVVTTETYARRIDVGGLVGQPNHAYLLEEWLDEMDADPEALRFTGHEILEVEPRMAWARVRHHAPDVPWPPRGVHLRMDYEPASPTPPVRSVLVNAAPRLVFIDAQDGGWKLHVTKVGEPAALTWTDHAAEIRAPQNTAVFAERPWPNGARVVECTIDPGTDRSASWGPGLAVVFRGGEIVKFNIRPGAGRAEGGNALGDYGAWALGREHLDRGRHAGRTRPALPVEGRRYTLRIRLTYAEVICEAMWTADGSRETDRISLLAGDLPGIAEAIFRFPRTDRLDEPVAVRVGKLGRAGGGSDHGDPGAVGVCRISDIKAFASISPRQLRRRDLSQEGLRVSVHYEMYDGIPLFSKWITVHNGTSSPMRVRRFTSEILAAVEHGIGADQTTGGPVLAPSPLHVVTDYFGGKPMGNARRATVHWKVDPQYTSQVDYNLLTPCLLEVEPRQGPDAKIKPGATFESFRTWVLVHDSTDRERRGLAVRRMYRTVAPWVTENPLILHVVSVDPEIVKRAIDQAAECGFEMVSLSFGSGLNMEDEAPETYAKFKILTDYAAARGIHLGGYSLLASRRISPEIDNAINAETGRPGGQVFGYAPALASQWGTNYFRKLRTFFEETGFLQFTHDGSYPGDLDAAGRPTLQRGLLDSQWVQWRIITDFYAWQRGLGVYLRVPDSYHLSGANETGMGYREVNWSLPRAEQVLHTRQNIYDGTWEKTPSMGWMFVPLTQYHGGGAAATIEPLDEHVDHYERMILSNLGLGAQAVYRGHRLYDTPRVRDMVTRHVAWYKEYRDILESDLLHGRRADGRDLDWMLHVNPRLADKGMLVVYNPRERAVTKTIRVNLYYTGLTDVARVFHEGGRPVPHNLARDFTVDLEVTVPPGGMTWYVIR